MYLAIDIGNTRHKAALFSPEGKIVQLIDKECITSKEIDLFASQFPIRAAIVSSVSDPSSMERLTDTLRQKTQVVAFTHKAKLPIQIDYKTPETLGLDRIAAAVAAHSQFPDHHVMVIQAGTCIVTDFVTKEGHYLGGSISPGLQMRFDALHHFTQRLPQVSITHPTKFIGDSTESAIIAGVMLGVEDEINGMIHRYAQEFGEFKTVLTGGNKKDLELSIKNTIFAAHNFVLHGLYNILKINV